MKSDFKIIGTVSKIETLFELLSTPEKFNGCDVVELRLDEHMDQNVCLELCQKVRQYKEVLLTIRTDREGGSWTINDRDRFDIFKSFENDVDYIDIELKSELFAQQKRSDFSSKIKVIGSFHDYEATPSTESINALIKQGRDWQIDIVKLALFIKSEEDTLRLNTFLGQEALCLIGMGTLGIKTRTEFTQKGSCLTYGYLDESAAPGQLSAAELKKILR
jgi:3-dehydroquinate dehydratase-1